MTMCQLVVLLLSLALRLASSSPVTRQIHQMQTSNDLTGLTSSPNDMRLRRGEHLYVYHDYQSVPDPKDPSKARIKFAFKEVIPFYRHVIYRRSDTLYQNISALHTRGFVVDPTHGSTSRLINSQGEFQYVSWKWMDRTGGRCPVIIPFCFRDVASRDAIKDIASAAFQLWRDALGPARGVDFRLTAGHSATSLQDHLCGSSAGRWSPMIPNSAVEIYNTFSGTKKLYSGSYTGPGYIFGKTPGRMRLALEVDPKTDTAGSPKIVAALAHELGHVMGLNHEHQRFDAVNHILVKEENIVNITTLDDDIKTFNKHGFKPQLDRAAVFNDYVLAMALNAVVDYSAPLRDLVPAKEGITLNYHEDYKVDGALDFESIMLYHSRAASGTGEPTMVRKSDGSTWGINFTPSKGDAYAIRRLYPDVQGLSPPPLPPNKPSDPPPLPPNKPTAVPKV